MSTTYLQKHIKNLYNSTRKQPDQKWAKNLNIISRRYTNGQKAYEKMPITNHQEMCK